MHKLIADLLINGGVYIILAGLATLAGWKPRNIAGFFLAYAGVLVLVFSAAA